ncbi:MULTISPECIES: PilW family protein [Campylobacter]|uniref:PilW family protein n=1 Tax=Campylobacter TaxID=194 RepID=UPI000A333110|nr:MULTISPECIES: prepilin-type N-terminal cleavage/methylation domain-containing protein [unclassified Campylobacter]MCR8678474.1 prepilin-type N-terminal cleavage/methylation domain-containing protein [Campylobacter sp. RM19072]MEE3704172.1 prepilin-type N-terminal cleavage/methylation domain-containing protein [Campylobacter sp. CX2-8023-23]
MRRAFSLIEMIICIVVGVILIGVIIQIYNLLYSNYLHTSSLNKLESSSINTMLIIENYLNQSIKESISIKSNNQILPLHTSINSDEFIWFNQSVESRQNSSSQFKWSGFVDIDNLEIKQNLITINSPLSSLNSSLKDRVINNLKFDNDDIRVIFKGSDNIYQNAYKILSSNGENITIQRENQPIFVSEIYYLSHNLISLKLQDNTLILNEFSPKNLNSPIRSNILATNVSSFNIKQNGGNIIFSLCMFDNDVELCKSSGI